MRDGRGGGSERAALVTRHRNLPPGSRRRRRRRPGEVDLCTLAVRRANSDTRVGEAHLGSSPDPCLRSVLAALDACGVWSRSTGGELEGAFKPSGSPCPPCWDVFFSHRPPLFPLNMCATDRLLTWSTHKLSASLLATTQSQASSRPHRHRRHGQLPRGVPKLPRALVSSPQTRDKHPHAPA